MWNRIRSEDDNETKRLWSFRHKLSEKYEVGMTYAYVICIPILSFDSTPKKFPCLPTYVTALIVTYRHCTLYDYVVICPLALALAVRNKHFITIDQFFSKLHSCLEPRL